MKYWQESEELIDSDSLKILQFERLTKTFANAYNNVAFYNKIFNEQDIDIKSIKRIEDISKLPFTYKKDLATNYPYGMFAVDLKEIVRIHSSSGTTGKPTVVGYTKNDMKLWRDMIARILVMGGLSQHDIIQICFTYGLFTGGFGLHQGAEHVGATVIPASSGNTERQIMLMRDYKTTAIVASPSYALHIAEVMQSEGVKQDDLCLKYGFFGSEPWGETIREEIESKLKIHATDNYGLTEMMGPGVAGECLCKSGMHINEDHFYAEIIDPDTLEVLPIGEVGELVLTTLTREAMPMIRYRTRDITKLYRDNCECGRKFLKMGKPIGRTDDMFIINGVNIYPSQVEQALKGITGITPHFMIYLKKHGKLDSIELQIETSDTYFFDSMKTQKEFLDKLTHKLTSALQVKPKVKLVMPKSLERFTGKAKRVVDERNNQ